jgi:hypothetical protein
MRGLMIACLVSLGMLLLVAAALARYVWLRRSGVQPGEMPRVVAADESDTEV